MMPGAWASKFSSLEAIGEALSLFESHILERIPPDPAVTADLTVPARKLISEYFGLMK